MEHFYDNLPGWFDFADLYRSEVQRLPDGASVVELGCFAGRSAAFMAVEIINSGKDIHFYAIDKFDHEARALQQFRENMRPVFGAFFILAGDSARSAEHFLDGTIDFVFVDAGHELKSVSADLEAWWPKIARGGHLAGHDYDAHEFPGVVAAVDLFATLNRLSIEHPTHNTWLVVKP